MYLSIATVSLSDTLREKVECIAMAGYEHVEIFEANLIVFDDTIENIASLTNEHGSKVDTLQRFRDCESLEGKAKKLHLIEQRLSFTNGVARHLLLMVCSSLLSGSQGGIQRLAAHLQDLVDTAAKRNMRIDYGAVVWGRHIIHYRDRWGNHVRWITRRRACNVLNLHF